jgi:excisionase family DNA binding protein
VPAIKEGTETLTIEQAAAMLGISRGLAYELAKSGELPGVIRFRRRYVVSKARIEEVLARGERNEKEIEQAELDAYCDEIGVE